MCTEAYQLVTQLQMFVQKMDNIVIHASKLVIDV